jgi:thymidine phosphorylase
MSQARAATGTFFLVVGPSGAGKDTLIDGARRALASASYVFARRVITRPAGAPGEDHEAETPEGFAAREAAGEFLITWQAHGLHYGLPAELLSALACGRHVVANGSRATVDELGKRVPGLVVVEISAPPEVLAQRIAGRGREDHAQILARLQRQVDPIPPGILRQRVSNDSDAAAGIERFLSVLRDPVAVCVAHEAPADTGEEAIAFAPSAQWPAGTRLRLRGASGRLTDVRVHNWEAQASTQDRTWQEPWLALSPALMRKLDMQPGATVQALRIQPAGSRHFFTRKLRGDALKSHEYQAILQDAVDGRYNDTELTAWLVETTRSLDATETLALAEARSRIARRIVWDEPMVVDKHSLGGVPGSRITPIVVPIVAAYGLAMPKASSGAITSAAGTADTMALLAEVELSPEAVQRCVKQARACIAWNGRLNHSVIDDVMNRITRPYGLETAAWSVASILSKKVTAGVTHLVIDVPYGPYAKQDSLQQAQALCALFEQVGAGLGIQVRALATDGSRPIGRGIGPALEVRDIRQVLACDPDAPQDLREKALLFAGHILAFDPGVGDAEAGRRLATELLDSGAAQRAMERIIEVQGPPRRLAQPSALSMTVEAQQDGVVGEIDGWAIAGLARDAGAPEFPEAGVDLLCRPGQPVRAGQALYRLHLGSARHKELVSARMRAGASLTVPVIA